MKKECIADIVEIMDILPHRYPFLLVDKIIELVDYEKCVGIKCVSFNEPQFQGHFPGHPIMPGIMLVEAMAQVASLMALIPERRSGETFDDKVVYFMSLEEAKFRKPVVPGDVLEIVTEKIQHRGNIWKFKGTVLVDGVVHADAKFTALLKDK